jgi:hypothetical protein
MITYIGSSLAFLTPTTKPICWEIPSYRKKPVGIRKNLDLPSDLHSVKVIRMSQMTGQQYVPSGKRKDLIDFGLEVWVLLTARPRAQLYVGLESVSHGSDPCMIVSGLRKAICL